MWSSSSRLALGTSGSGAAGVTEYGQENLEYKSVMGITKPHLSTEPPKYLMETRSVWMEEEVLMGELAKKNAW